MQAAGKPAGGSADGAGARQAPGSPGGGGEVTEAQLREGEEEGAASIVRVYAALLLGFLAVAQRALWQARSARIHSPLEGCCVVGKASRVYAWVSGVLLIRPAAFQIQTSRGLVREKC